MIEVVVINRLQTAPNSSIQKYIHESNASVELHKRERGKGGEQWHSFEPEAFEVVVSRR